MQMLIDIDDEQVLFDIKNRGFEAKTETDKVIINALYNGTPLEELSDDKCDRCGKKHYVTRHKVDCKYISSRIENTERLLCPDCYKIFKRYLKQQYEDFFTYFKENKE